MCVYVYMNTYMYIHMLGSLSRVGGCGFGPVADGEKLEHGTAAVRKGRERRKRYMYSGSRPETSH